MITDKTVRDAAWKTFPDAHSVRITFLGDEHAWITTEEGPDTNPHTRDYCFDPACETFTGSCGTIEVPS